MPAPPPFVWDDPAEIAVFVAENPFATVVSQGELLKGSHLPLLLDATGETWRLTGHFARGNRQSQFVDDSPVLAIFHGPHAYISPSWYETDQAVPTWNYVVAHLRGAIRRTDDVHVAAEQLATLADRFEDGRPNAWSLEAISPERVAGLLDHIVPFEIEVESFEGKRKLSQNHQPERCRTVADRLSSSGRDHERAIAALMLEVLPEPDGHSAK